MGKGRILMTCAKGLASFLKEELQALGHQVVSQKVALVESAGSFDDTMRLNLQLRTAHRVLLLLTEFEAEDADELYREVVKIEWEDYIPEGEPLCVTSSVDTPTIRDSRFANLKTKDAIVDRIKRRRGWRPNSGPERDGVVVHLFWKDRQCALYFDTSGDPLAKRGYRKIPLKAPMQETLAAAVVLASGWDGKGSFVNPMCGSGTLAIEAALIALHKAPGLLRSNFGFMHLKGYDESSWKDLRRKARKETLKSLEGRIIATDVDPEAVRAARKNAATAGVEHLIDFGVCDYSETMIPEGGGVVVVNPEYGARLGEVERLKAVYKGVGDFFKQKCLGYRGYIFTGNLQLAKKVGLRTRRRIPFFNSNIECRLLEYDLYEGSKKRSTGGP